MKKNILTSLLFMVAMLLQAQTIDVNGTKMLANQNNSFPLWLSSGSSVSPEYPVFSISAIEFSIVESVEGSNMVFSRVLEITETQTVPEGTTWKIESVQTANQEDYITQADLDAANSALADASANVADLESQLETAMLNQEDGITQVDVDSVQADLDAANSALADASANVADLESQLETAMLNQEDGIGQDDVDAAYADGAASVTPLYQVGDMVEGGIVFYVDATGEHGLVAAQEDLEGTYEWGCYLQSVSGADSQWIGSGLQNTMDITNQGCATENGGVTAAQAALDAEINGYSDWYLPSRDELYQMYLNIGQGGLNANNIGGFSNDFYWSSSEFNSSYAWPVFFFDGTTYFNYKYGPDRVRVIRAF